MIPGSMTFGRLAGATLRIHWSAILIASLLALGLASDLGAIAACVGVVAFFASILGHELAHAYVARRFGVGTTSIQLWALGGSPASTASRARPRPRGGSPPPDRSPASSSARSPTAPPSSLGARRPRPVVTVLGWLGVVNVALGVFNLLPGAPLDGGRIVQGGALVPCTATATGRCARPVRPGRSIGWALAGVGLALMLNGRPGLLLLVTGVFIAINAKAEIAFADVAERLDGITRGRADVVRGRPDRPDMDADTMIWQRSRIGGAGIVAVARRRRRTLDGLVLEDQLWAVPVEQRPWVMLTSLMAPFSRLARADPDEELASVLPRLDPLRPIVTVWRDGRLLGVVPPNALRQKPAAAPRCRSSAGRVLNAGRQASRTAQARLATGSLSLHGKLIHRSVRFQT